MIISHAHDDDRGDDDDTGGVEYDDGDENRCQMPRKWDEGGRSLVSAAKIKFKTWNQTQSTQPIIWDFLKDVLIVNLFCNHYCFYDHC